MKKRKTYIYTSHLSCGLGRNGSSSCSRRCRRCLLRLRLSSGQFVTSLLAWVMSGGRG